MTDFRPVQFAELLRKAKGNRSITSFGTECRVDPGYLSRFIREKLDRPPSPEIIYRIADKAYMVTYEDLMVAAGYLEADQQLRSTELRNAVHQPEGKGIRPQKLTFGVGEFPWAEIKADSCFYYLVREDSMNGARILAGDLVLILRQSEVKDGEIALVETHDGEAILRRVFLDGNKIILQPENPAFKLLSLSSQQVQVLGKVIMVHFNPNQTSL